ADITIANDNYTDSGTGDIIGDKGVGIIEVYFRDINDEMVCKIQFGDTSSQAASNHVLFKTPDTERVFHDTKRTGWNDFRGTLRVTRDSGYFHIKISETEGGQVVSERNLGQIIP